MKKEHFDLFNEVCLEAGIPLKVMKSMHDFIQKDADANGDEVDLLPHTARLRSMSYSSSVLVDVVHDIYDGEEHKERRIFRETLLCKLPLNLTISHVHPFCVKYVARIQLQMDTVN